MNSVVKYTKQIVGLFNGIRDVIEDGINHQTVIGTGFTADEANYVRGGGIIMMVAWVERQFPKKDWEQRFDIPRPFSWPGLDGWLEFINFNRIRNCFAHYGNGTMFPNKSLDIENFL